jgi:hypothetical protein
MSTNKDLFKEAIADAKQVREAALANAKAALEEALAPKLQSMISAKLQEMEKEGEEEEPELKEVDYFSANDHRNDSDPARKRAIDAGQMSEGEEELEEDFDLSEILAELDAEKDEEKEKIKEAEEEEVGEEEEVEDEESEDEPTEEPTEEETAEGDKITDLTVDQLKDIIKDIISSELEAEEYETSGDEEAEMDGEEMGIEMGTEEPDMEIAEEEENEIDLEELLAELDALNEGEEKEELEEVSSEGIAALVGLIPGVTLTAALIKDIISNMKSKGLKGIDGFMKAYKEVGADASAHMDKTVGGNRPGQGHGAEGGHFGLEEASDLEEAIETINTLRNELNETNLLNAKLLYVNKIFKAKNLSESQKLKVIASFDKATTPKQAKELFESIQTSTLGASKKSQIKESLGFASKAAGVAPKSTIVESNDVIARMQKLANIIK